MSKTRVSLYTFDSHEFAWIIQQIGKGIEGVEAMDLIWVCARKSIFDIRWDQHEQMRKIAKETTALVHLGFRVILPILFYPCDPKDIRERVPEEDDDFIVFNHVNIILVSPLFDASFSSVTGIEFERYEPSCTVHQNQDFNMDAMMRSMMEYWFKPYTSHLSMVWLETETICPYGTQVVLNDKTLCTLHIFYWLAYRLVHNREKAREKAVLQFNKKKFYYLGKKLRQLVDSYFSDEWHS